MLHAAIMSYAWKKWEIALLQGQPKDGPEDKFRLTPVVPCPSKLIGTTVRPPLLRAYKE